MAGYVFSVGSNKQTDKAKDAEILSTIKEVVEKGIFSVRMNRPKKQWNPTPYEGTLTDYLSMKPGDNIYFFGNRKYYGVGEIIQVGPDCKYANYRDSVLPVFPPIKDIQDEALYNKGADTSCYKWFCTFKGAPAFFEEGIDSDDVLTYKPETFKILRAFWKVSFIKLGEEENQSLKEIMLLRHQKQLNSKKGLLIEKAEFHEMLQARRLDQYLIKLAPLLNQYHDGDKLQHEMALEASTVDALVQGSSEKLGKWDYVSHQVVASPLKPTDYMDKIDVFAYRFLEGTNIPCEYLVAELKKDEADISTVDQVMKYVDWVKAEYTYGDYGAIKAYIIAYDFSEQVVDYVRKNVQRYYSIGYRPVHNKTWNNITLIKYKYDNGEIVYS